jgi:tripartite-type tricarboxylate transporter receptor subunit TctC
MATVLFEQVAGIRMTHIPYKGGGEALAALLGGQVDLLINPLLGDTKSDKIISLAITGNSRSVLAPDVPTFKELGYDYGVGVYYGVMGPKAVPGKVVDRINESVNEALADKDVVDALSARSGIVLQRMTPAEFQNYLDRDIDLWKKIVTRK